MIKLVPFLALLSLAVAQSAESGNWGLYKIMNRDTKCYSYDEGRNEMWTRDCNKDDHLQLWRYDTRTSQLQNKAMTESKGEPYCAVLSEVGNLKPIRMSPCWKNSYTMFTFRKGAWNGVIAQSFAPKLDGGRCIDVDQWSEARDENIWTAPCETMSRDRTDHWTVFESVSEYKGRDLVSLPKQASFKDGNWGSLRITPALDVCYGVNVGDRLELIQQPCDDLDMGQKWRYNANSIANANSNANSMTISNYRFPLDGRDAGCLTYDVNNNQNFIEKCQAGLREQQFRLREDQNMAGSFQQIITLSDPRRCIDVDGWNRKGVWRMITAPCEAISVKDSDHWVRFDFYEAGVVCPAGHFRTGQRCTLCRANTFAKEGADECRPCREGTQSKAGSSMCTVIPIPTCQAGTFVNGKYHNCIWCPVNSFSDTENAAACTKCEDGYEAKRPGSTSCTEVPKRKIIATAKNSDIGCVVGKTKPLCAMQCRFRTSDGFFLRNPEDVSYFKQVGREWVEFNTTSEYNKRYSWHRMVIAKKPTSTDGGLYKCEITYEGMTASAEMMVMLAVN